MTDMEAKTRDIIGMMGLDRESNDPHPIMKALTEAHREGMEMGRENAMKATLPDLGKSLDEMIQRAKNDGMEDAAKVADEHYKYAVANDPSKFEDGWREGAEQIAIAIREKIKGGSK